MNVMDFVVQSQPLSGYQAQRSLFNKEARVLG